MNKLEFAKEQLKKHPEKNEILTNIPEWVEVGRNVHIARGVHFSSRGFGYIEIDDNYYHIPHSGKLIIGDNVEIFEGVNLVRATADDGETRIGKNTKIDYNCHIAHNVKIGEDCFIIAGTILGGSVEIGNGCHLGIGCMIKNKVKIGNNVTVGMGAVVTKNIPDGETWVGNPARRLKQTFTKIVRQ